MKNPLFEAVANALANLEHEMSNMESRHIAAEDAAKGVQARVDQLRKNETELNASNNATAAKLAEARKALADAQDHASSTLSKAQYDANSALGEAKNRADKLLADAKRDADALRADAKKTHQQDINLKKAELDDLTIKLQMAKDELAKMKAAARAFVGE